MARRGRRPTVEPFLRGSDFADLASAEDIAFGVVAFFMGLNLVSRLQDDEDRIERLLAMAGRLGPLLSPFFPAS